MQGQLTGLERKGKNISMEKNMTSVESCATLRCDDRLLICLCCVCKSPHPKLCCIQEQYSEPGSADL